MSTAKTTVQRRRANSNVWLRGSWRESHSSTDWLTPGGVFFYGTKGDIYEFSLFSVVKLGLGLIS